MSSSPAWLRFVLGLAVVLVACGIAYHVNSVPRVATSERVYQEPIHLLHVAPEKLNFGDVWSQNGFVWQLPIQNRSSRALAIEDLVSSCGCAAVAIRPKPLTIAPGGTADVGVVLNLQSREALNSPKRVVDVTVAFAVRLKNEPPANILLSGRVLRPFQVEPQVIQFGNEFVEDLPFKDRAVTVTALHPVRD